MTGCAASTGPQQTSQARLTAPVAAVATAPDTSVDAAAATALVFMPASPAGHGMPDLSRDAREPSAFGGFQGVSTEYYEVQTDDDQLFESFPSSYERRVISDKVGTIFR